MHIVQDHKSGSRASRGYENCPDNQWQRAHDETGPKFISDAAFIGPSGFVIKTLLNGMERTK